MMRVHFRIFVPGKDPEDVWLPRHVEGCDEVPFEPEEILNVKVDGYICSMFFGALDDPRTTRVFLDYLRELRKKSKFLVNVHVTEPRKPPLDVKGGEMFEKSALERRELDHALAWFSTLGGAFSALGDSMATCAVMAGKISTQQFKLALRLGDPNLQSRCRLYMALSQIQLKNFALAKRIVRSEYDFANSQVVKDTKLLSMCHGIWAKLKYDRKQAQGDQKHKQLPAS